jgi:hypothetical protein
MYEIQNYYRCFKFLYKFILEFKQTSINVVFFQKQLRIWASCWYLCRSAPHSTKPVAVLMAHTTSCYFHSIGISYYNTFKFMRHSHRHMPTDLLTWHLYSLYHYTYELTFVTGLKMTNAFPTSGYHERILPPQHVILQIAIMRNCSLFNIMNGSLTINLTYNAI